MDTLTRMLRRFVRSLPEERRDWGEAVLAEATEVPSGRSRLSWLAGGFWFVAREIGLLRSTVYGFVGVAASVALVVFAWNPGSTDPAALADRIDLIATVAMLTLLPWVGRWRGWLGPAGSGRATRVVRAGGYLLVWGLLLVRVGVARFAGARFEHFQAFDQARWESDRVSGEITGSVVIFVLMTVYAAGILAMTARRAVGTPRALVVGASLGGAGGVMIYALTPLGNLPGPGLLVLLLVVVLGTPVLAGRLAGRQALRAGLWSGVVAALVITDLTITTMLLAPRAVPLIWANPDPAAPHGTPFEIQMTVGDTAGRYLVVLMLAPLIGLLGGALSGGAASSGSRSPGGA